MSIKKKTHKSRKDMLNSKITLNYGPLIIIIYVYHSLKSECVKKCTDN